MTEGWTPRRRVALGCAAALLAGCQTTEFYTDGEVTIELTSDDDRIPDIFVSRVISGSDGMTWTLAAEPGELDRATLSISAPVEVQGLDCNPTLDRLRLTVSVVGFREPAVHRFSVALDADDDPFTPRRGVRVAAGEEALGSDGHALSLEGRNTGWLEADRVQSEALQAVDCSAFDEVPSGWLDDLQYDVAIAWTLSDSPARVEHTPLLDPPDPPGRYRQQVP